eukprot:8985985-Pyramimonas_sp.AAC.1
MNCSPACVRCRGTPVIRPCEVLVVCGGEWGRTRWLSMPAIRLPDRCSAARCFTSSSAPVGMAM